MHIGNIRFCKKVVNAFVIGAGLGFVTGGLVVYLKDKKVLNDLEYYYLDRIESYREKAFSGKFPWGESKKDNPLSQSDEIKRRITERLENLENQEAADKIITSLEYSKKEPADHWVSEANRIGYDMLPKDEHGNVLTEAEARALWKDLHFLDPEDQLDEDEDEAIRISEDLHGGEPYTISREQFLGSCEDFVKTTIGYYAGDDTLVDDKGDIVDSEERDIWIGKNALSRFGEDSGDEDTVYIRNPFIHTDFEVVRYFEEYDESEVR